MAETIEHRIMNLTGNGIFILTVDGIKNLKSKNPLPLRSFSADTTPNISNDELLGYFENRGAEYVVDKCYAPGSDFTRKSSIQNHAAITSAFEYGKRDGIFNDNSETAIFEVHAIVDPECEKTHYFLMPHRDIIAK